MSQVKLYTKRAFKFKKTVFSIEFVRKIPAILKLMVKDVKFLTIKVDVKTIIEIKIDVFLFVYINCSFNFGCIAQHTVSSFL